MLEMDEQKVQVDVGVKAVDEVEITRGGVAYVRGKR